MLCCFLQGIVDDESLALAREREKKEKEEEEEKEEERKEGRVCYLERTSFVQPYLCT